VQDVKASDGDPAVDRPWMHTQLEQLPARDDAVLKLGERRNRGVDPTRSTFATDSVVNVDGVPHGREHPRRGVTGLCGP
jgi:hypothetical protein